MKLSTWCPVTCPAKRWRTSGPCPTPTHRERQQHQRHLRQQGGQARKHRYRNLSLIRKNNCSLRATLTLNPGPTPGQSERKADPPTSSLGLTPRSEESAKHKEQPDLPEPAAAKVLQANTVKRETLALHNRSKRNIGTWCKSRASTQADMKLSTWCPVTCPAKRWRTSRASPTPTNQERQQHRRYCDSRVAKHTSTDTVT